MVSVIGIALAAAFFLAVAAVLQHRAAAEAPPAPALHPGLITDLLKRKAWLAGIVVMIVGYGFQAWALGSGEIILVEPVLAASLLFGLPISAAWFGQRMHRREWAAALLASAGIACFLIAADPSGGRSDAPMPSWGVAFGVVGAAIIIGIVVGLRRGDFVRSVSLAAAGGLAFGLTDAITKPFIVTVSRAPADLLTAWQTYALIGIGICGFWLVQSAYHAGHIASALPAIMVLEPLTACLLGIVLFQEEVRADGPFPFLEALAALAAIVGVATLAHSPMVTGNPMGSTAPRRRRVRT